MKPAFQRQPISRHAIRATCTCGECGGAHDHEEDEALDEAIATELTDELSVFGLPYEMSALRTAANETLAASKSGSEEVASVLVLPHHEGGWTALTKRRLEDGRMMTEPTVPESRGSSVEEALARYVLGLHEIHL